MHNRAKHELHVPIFMFSLHLSLDSDPGSETLSDAQQSNALLGNALLSGLMGRVLQAVDNWSNFETYRLRRPVGLIRADTHRSPFRESLAEVSLLYSAELRRCTLY